MKTKRILCNLLMFGFLLGIYEGKIALWKDNKKDPIRVFPYSASSLPEKDRQALEKGVHFKNLTELKQFAQEYLS